MMLRFLCLFLFVLATANLQNSPPHCTTVSKVTDYASKFRFDYPVAYLIPGQYEAYQKLYCLNPASVNKAVATVCDWVAPPLVQFTLGDDYMHVVRQDPSGRYNGNAVINTYQLCSHNMIPHVNKSLLPTIYKIEESNYNVVLANDITK